MVFRSTSSIDPARREPPQASSSPEIDAGAPGCRTEVRREARLRFPGRLVIGQVHFLILHAAPQALREDIVHEAPAPVHRDPRPRCKDAAREPLAREVAALVAVDDLGHGPTERGPGAGQHERHSQRLG